MKNYQSCLFPILQVLYNEYVENKKFSKIDSPKHLKNFIELFENASSEQEVIKIIENALKESSSCKLCLSCKKCANLFYLEIAKLRLSEYDKTSFPEIYKKISDDFGKLSFRKAPKLLARHFDNHNSSKNYYENRSKTNQITRDIENNIIILKGMSSSSPYIYNNIFASKQYTGGGLYVNWQGTGIAIDPGYGFVENMYKNKISIYDIDNVIVTHSHIDHSNDMRILDDLNYNFPKSVKSKSKKLMWYVDNDTEQKFHEGFDDDINEFFVVKSDTYGQEVCINENISFTPFSTIHMKTAESKTEISKDTFGVVIKLKDGDNIYRIGYTSDTKYYSGLEKELENCDIIIANISGIYLDDYLLINPKKNHLGYSGCYSLIENLKSIPKLFILSEFWNGTTDLRFDVCRTLFSEFTKDKKFKIMPGDIGMHIDILNQSVKCSQCGNYSSFEDVKLIRPHEDFGKISYICKDCLY